MKSFSQATLHSHVEGVSVIEALAQVYPPGLVMGGFRFNLASDGDQLLAILRCLTKCGLRPHLGSQGMPVYGTEYHLHVYMRYDEPDLAAAEYLDFWVNHCDGVADIEKPPTSDGRHRVDIASISPDSFFCANASGTYHMVADGVRRELDEQRFAGLEFKPVALLRRDEGKYLSDGSAAGVILDAHPETKDRYWFVSPSVALPPCVELPPDQVPRIRPFAPYEDLPKALREYECVDHRMIYRAAAIRQLPPFDIAQSQEFTMLGQYLQRRRTIVSQRLFRFLRPRLDEPQRRRGMEPPRWVPVRLVD